MAPHKPGSQRTRQAENAWDYIDSRACYDDRTDFERASIRNILKQSSLASGLISYVAGIMQFGRGQQWFVIMLAWLTKA